MGVLTDDEQQEIVQALRNLLRSKPNSMGDLRRLARMILDRIDSASVEGQ